MRRVRSSVLPSIVGARASAALLVAAVVVMLVPAVASAAPKAGVATIGGPATGTTGGLFNNPRGVAINQAGAGGVAAGTIYVADSTNNRIQRFNADGSFDSAWGQDVDQTAVGTGYEVCTALSGNVCKAGITTAQTGGAMNLPQAVAVDQSDGSVYVLDQSNRRVQKFTATGIFVWAAGWDVVNTGLGNDATGTLNQFETCVAANGDVCKIAAAAGANAGQFGAGATGIAVSPSSGQVVVADGSNRRVQKLSSAGAFVAAIGYDVVPTGQAGDVGVTLEACPASAAQVTGGCQGGQGTNGGANPGQFFTNQPTAVATDSGGAIYAVEGSGSNNRVQRLTPSGSSAVTLAPALAAGSPAPVRVAVDQSNDHVYVVKETGGVLEFDSLGGYVDTYAATAGLPANSGLDVRSSTGNIYYATTTNHRIAVLGGNFVAPTATQDPVTTFTATTATFSGTVNPTGLVTGYHFEYRRDQDATFTKFPVADADAGPVNSVNPVTQNVTGLQPNILYHVRLVATKAYGAGVATTSEVTFTTSTDVPIVSSVSFDDLSDTSVTPTGRVNPNNQDTSYRFEYGTADCASNPCTRTPDPDVTLAASAGNTFVKQQITGLAPNTTYHYRLVATNTTGTTSSPDQTLTTTSAPAPATQGPDGYELVSPPGGERYTFPLKAASNPHPWATDARLQMPDGRCFTYLFGGTLPGMAVDGEGSDPIVACRGAEGWVGRSPAGDRTTCSYEGSTGSAGGNAVAVHDLAVDGARTIGEVGFCPENKLKLSGGLDQQPYATPIAASGSMSLYGTDLDTDLVSFLTGAYDALGPIPRTDTQATNYLGGSSDLRTIYFSTKQGLLPGVPSFATGTVSYIYRHTDGVTTLVTRSPGGAAVTANVDTVNGSRMQPHGAVSEDGAAVTFTAPQASQLDIGDTNTVNDVYQVRGSTVVWVSKSAFTGAPQTAATRTFVGASSSGRRIFFSTTEKLVGDGTSTGDLNAVADVYAYDENASVGQELSRVSVPDASCGVLPLPPGQVACTAAASATAAAFSAVSPDGSHVFFTTTSILDPRDTDSQASLYVRDVVDGTTTYVVQAGSDTSSLTSNLVMQRPITTTDDGSVAVFSLTTQVNLPTGRGGADADGASDLFVWREGEGLRRVRQGPGSDDNTSTAPTIGCLLRSYNCPALTSDGTLAYFLTTDSVAAGDSDAGLRDVYAVDTRSGKVLLISPAGSAPYHAEFAGASASGSDVFFTTGEAVDPSRDTDSTDLDLYDARTGVPVLPPVAPDVCSGDDCQGLPGAPPANPTPDSTKSDGPGNAGSEARATIAGIRKLSASDRSALVKGKRARLRLRVSRSGTVTLAGKARIGRKQRRVASSSVEASKAGTVTIPFALSKSARSQLRRKRLLKLSLTVRFKDARPKVVVVTLRSAAKKKGGAR